MRHHVLLYWLLLAALIAFMIVPPQGAAAAQSSSETDIMMDVLARMNVWRISQGLMPLKVNPVLMRMAQDQADFVAPRASAIEDEAEYHKDEQGRDAKRRAVERYNYPFYGNPEQVEVGEIVAVGNTSFAFGFWERSDSHRRTALNPVYREIGIGVVKKLAGDVYYVTLGARPNVLTALVAPDRQSLYVTLELSPYRPMSPSATTVQLIDVEGKPLTEVRAWSSQIPLPSGLPNVIQVKVVSGTFQTQIPVNLTTDLVVVDTKTLPASEVFKIISATPIPPTAEAGKRAVKVANEADMLLDIFAQLNKWRIAEGFAPLRINTTLMRMAQAQADYVAPRLGEIEVTGKYHDDEKGRNVRQRAVQVYNWPFFKNPDRVEVGENAAVGNVSFAIGYWQRSDIHRKAALSAAYREVGIGVVKQLGGNVFIVVFGSRPYELTALVAPDRQHLYVTLEFSRYGALSPSATTVQLLSVNGNPLTATLAWSPQIPLPAGLTGVIQVKVVSGTFSTTIPVDLSLDIAVVDTQTLSADAVFNRVGATPIPTPAVASLPTVTLVPNSFPNTATPTPRLSPSATSTVKFTLTPTPTPIMRLVTSFPTNTRPAPLQTTPVGILTTPTATAFPTIPITAPPMTPTPTQAAISPTTVGGKTDLLLTYSADSIALVNVAPAPLNLTGLAITNGERRIALEAWLRVASFPAERFSMGHCLAAVAFGGAVVMPSECRVLRSEIQVAANQAVWRSATFQVTLGDQVIGVCAGTERRCAVSFPKAAGGSGN